jgi:hypothetical protein
MGEFPEYIESNCNENNIYIYVTKIYVGKFPGREPAMFCVNICDFTEPLYANIMAYRPFAERLLCKAVAR